MNRNQPQSKQIQINLTGCPVMFKGLKADFHVNRYNAKLTKNPFDAGFDLYPANTDPKVIHMSTATIIWVDTLVHMHIMPGSVGIIQDRSSSTVKLDGARIKPGIIDAGYTGEIKVGVVTTKEHHKITLECISRLARENIAIAQMLVMPVHRIVPSAWLDSNVQGGRGDAGFGSTDGSVIQSPN